MRTNVLWMLKKNMIDDAKIKIIEVGFGLYLK